MLCKSWMTFNTATVHSSYIHFTCCSIAKKSVLRKSWMESNTATVHSSYRLVTCCSIAKKVCYVKVKWFLNLLQFPVLIGSLHAVQYIKKV